ncbi:MAG: M28 family peptidase [Candidatus Helarchaeota archaeon]
MIEKLGQTQDLEIINRQNSQGIVDEKNAYNIAVKLSFPRLIGSEGEKKAIKLVKEQFQKIGYEPLEEIFETSFSNWKMIRYLFMIFGGCLFINGILFFIIPLITMVLSGCYIWLCLYISRLSGEIGKFGTIYETKNILSTKKSRNAKINIVFMAHWDSKGQTIRGSTRILLMAISLIGFIVISILYLIFSILRIFWFSNNNVNLGLSITSIVIIGISFTNIFNRITNNSVGAIDNAASVGVLIELARYFRDDNYMKNSNLYFVSTGSEELNLGGSEAFIKNHYNELKNLKTYFINFDLVGSDGTIEMVSSYGIPKKKTSEVLLKLFRNEAIKQQIPFKTMYLPFGAWCDLMPAISKGFEGCWLASESTFSIAHTKKDTIDKISRKGLKDILSLTIGVVEELDILGEKIKIK